MLKLILLSSLFYTMLCANILQDAINSASEGSVISLKRGVYKGNITINKALSIIGEEDGVIIEGERRASTIRIESPNVILKNLTITDSGNTMIGIDSAIQMYNVHDCRIIRCRLLNSLYGIDMAMVNNSIISDNYITSKENPISLKGDGIKAWYSNHNIIQNNTFDKVRDVTFTRSHSNIIKNNLFSDNRFALHVSLSDKNRIKNNTFKHNSTAIIIMGAKDTTLKNNLIQSSRGAAGIGLVIKGVSNFKLQHNTIRYNAKGIYIDSTNKERGMQRYITDNIIAYNKEAMHFHAVIKNNTIKNNRIYGNIEDIIKDIEGIPTNSNIIEYNYWDRYAGFDKNKDNIGDTPHRVYQYADQLWHYNNKIKFFYASPIMSLLNFLTAIAPFIEPVLLLEDTNPLIQAREHK